MPHATAVHARFWMQPLMLCCLLAAPGVSAVEQLLLWAMYRLGLGKVTAKSPSSERFKGVMLASLLAALLSSLLKSRWALMDKSSVGWTMHRYGEGLLMALPRGALLVSHTDLDLNTARYLQTCENTRPGQDKVART